MLARDRRSISDPSTSLKACPELAEGVTSLEYRKTLASVRVKIPLDTNPRSGYHAYIGFLTL